MHREHFGEEETRAVFQVYTAASRARNKTLLDFRLQIPHQGHFLIQRDNGDLT